ncbi:hypothetical protein FEM48_Zijuj07G0049100 [Ziziphus jujuba var. spinosa]|uniref:Response regulatory domain-containing protein n=1 Tax=Ziziphus jujuba var. spinosa TaxID=714518 RepID=A0A978V2K4_ZIZJJ|nr:uncharacterized protein LOC125423152 [Ziziphus jujuba var. spinosa]KAH7521587.1 hypothetical protein FEM48_Zijuj07G0049100 [Ziziphus jujuba var. spinosa]
MLLQGSKVNLIMTDYCMPGMSGYDLLKRVKGSSWKDVPVVIMSSENVPSRINIKEDGVAAGVSDHGEWEDQCYRKHRSITLGSIKEFNFDSTKSEFSDKPTNGSEWWANEKVAGKESKPGNGWTFFPILQPGVS